MGRLLVGGHVAAFGVGVGALLQVLDLLAEFFEIGLHGVDHAVLFLDVPFEEGLFYLKILDL